MRCIKCSVANIDTNYTHALIGLHAQYRCTHLHVYIQTHKCRNRHAQLRICMMHTCTYLYSVHTYRLHSISVTSGKRMVNRWSTTVIYSIIILVLERLPSIHVCRLTKATINAYWSTTSE